MVKKNPQFREDNREKEETMTRKKSDRGRRTRSQSFNCAGEMVRIPIKVVSTGGFQIPIHLIPGKTISLCILSFLL